MENKHLFGFFLKFKVCLQWSNFVLVCVPADDDELCTYIHAVVAAMFRGGGFGRSYCLHKLLFWACTLLFGEVATYVHAVPCCYLHSAVAGLKITEYPNAPCLFYSRTGHLSPPQAIAQSDEAIPLTPRSLHVTECSCSLIFLTPRFGIDLDKVHMYKST